VVEAVRRIVGVVFRPQAEWDRIANEDTTYGTLIRRYIIPLSLLAPIATVVGMSVFDSTWDAGQGYRVPAPQILGAGMATLFALILSVFALAGIFVLIAPMYGSSRNYRDALKVSTFGAVPVMLAGATLLLPVMAIVGVVALVHSLFLFWIGAKEVLHVRRGEQAEFVGISILLLSVVSTIAGAAASSMGLF
jgi:hypothetical protein